MHVDLTSPDKVDRFLTSESRKTWAENRSLAGVSSFVQGSFVQDH